MMPSGELSCPEDVLIAHTETLCRLLYVDIVKFCEHSLGRLSPDRLMCDMVVTFLYIDATAYLLGPY